MEANSKLSRPPSFHESPKEDKENEREKTDWGSKDDSGTESDTEGSSEEESEDELDQEEETEGTTTSTVKPVAPRPEVKSNSISPKPEEESESEDESGSESEESSSEEEDQGKEPAVKPDLRNSATISTKPAQNTSSSVPNQGMGGTSRLVKSPSIDNDKKPAGPSSSSKTERFRPSGNAFQQRKEESTSPSWSYPTRTTAATTSNATSTTTTSIMGRANTTPSDDSQWRRTRPRRPATSNDRLDNGEEDKKSNDVSYSMAGGDNQRKVRLHSRKGTVGLWVFWSYDGFNLTV